jgi:hypothetical protein
MRGNFPLSTALFLLAFSLPLSASIFGTSGDGRVKTEERKTASFGSIEMSGVGRLSVSEGKVFKVEVRLDANLLPHYETRVQGGVLRLGFERGFAVNHLTDLEVRVTLPDLEGISLSGTADTVLVGPFSGASLAIDISGTGSVTGSIDYDRLSVGISGTGKAALKGKAARLRLDISGAGSFEGRDLAASTAKVGLSGSAQVELRVADSLSVDSSGASRLRYWGNPAVTAHSSGASSISRNN